MTDSEIIKALECCVESECEGCKYEYDTACKEYILHDCIRLIKQKQDEVRAYKHYYDECLKCLKNANAEIKRLNAEIEKLKYAIDAVNNTTIAHFKAEAVKEFVEKFKEKARRLDLSGSGALLQRDYTISEVALNNLVKESKPIISQRGE